ncbi:MAG: single-stranded DNA-binding protein [Nocardiopsaceae bacterium]|nr:single-stranded DNA-binding protein [Nocardiopsaceae bacterium]
MSNAAYIKLTGWVTRDPDLRKTKGDGTAVCTIRVGTANRWPDRSSGEWREGPASYYDVVCWRGLAANVASSLRKGQMVTVHGTFRNRAWTDKNNNPRISLEITAHSVGHDLTYGVSHFSRTYRGSPSSAQGQGEGEVSRALDLGQDGQEAETGPDGERARWPEDERPEGNPFRADEQADLAPSAGPAYEPAGERVSGAGDEGGATDTAEAVAGEPRLEEVAVPV